MANTSNKYKNVGNQLNAYELERRERIEKNQQVFTKLGVGNLKNSLSGLGQSKTTTKKKVRTVPNNSSKDMDYTPNMDDDDVAEDRQPLPKTLKKVIIL